MLKFSKIFPCIEIEDPVLIDYWYHILSDNWILMKILTHLCSVFNKKYYMYMAPQMAALMRGTYFDAEMTKTYHKAVLAA